MADPPDFYARLAEGYEEHIRQLVPSYDELMVAVLDVVRDEAPRHVLELGCGDGALADSVLKALPRARVTAVDRSPAMAERAAARLSPHGTRAGVVCADASGYEPRDTVDGVVSTLVLHNLEPTLRDASSSGAETRAGSRGVDPDSADLLARHVDRLEAPQVLYVP